VLSLLEPVSKPFEELLNKLLRPMAHIELPRHAEIWLPGYARDRARSLLRRHRPARVWVAITDHYEPLGGSASRVTALARVARWRERWPEIAENAPRDTRGNPPSYTFFYPQEEYLPELVAPLAEMTHAGIADVEVHLHHDRDTPEAFQRKVRTYCRQLEENHGLLHQESGRTIFGFIHGNWALDNSRPDGRWCGVTGEIQLLRDLGCYADFTMPSLPSPTQGRIINQVYWSTGDPLRPKSFNKGIEATVGGGIQGDLLMITGPLGLRYRERSIPRLETGEVAAYDPPTPYRVKRWLDLAPRIGDDIFIKLFAHGAPEYNADALLGGGLQNMFRYLHQAADERQLELHWATAFEMYRAVKNLVGVPQPEPVYAGVQG
jgi:hypothetical protein